MPGALGRRKSPDWKHVDKYPLMAEHIAEITAPRPLAIGVNWYDAFDRPEQDSTGHWWIARSGKLGSVRGGHCVALKPRRVTDWTAWWDFYDQGAEGACVGFGCSRVMTLMNRKAYEGRWLWDRAKERDGWSDTNPGDDNGTSVDAGMKVLRDIGHVAWRSAYAADDMDVAARRTRIANPAEGLQATRWIRSIDDALEVLGYQDVGYVDIINSWGRYYPHLTRLPVEVFERLWFEDGEVAVPTDR